MDEDEDDIDDLDDEAPEQEPDVRRDVEEAVASQKLAKGDPEPYRNLQGRDDTFKGGRYEGLEDFAHEARRNGTSLQQAVKDYRQVESQLRTNFPAAVANLAIRFGHDPRAIVHQLASQYNGAPVNQVNQHIAVQAQHQQAQHQVAAFSRDPSNKHFAALRLDMAHLVQAGRARTLQQAYRLALKLRPNLRVQSRIEQLDAKRAKDMRGR